MYSSIFDCHFIKVSVTGNWSQSQLAFHKTTSWTVQETMTGQLITFLEDDKTAQKPENTEITQKGKMFNQSMLAAPHNDLILLHKIKDPN